jgi:hypothetical protein
VHVRPLRWLVVAALLIASWTAAPVRARADEIAPELLTLELRQKASGELRTLVQGLTDVDRRRLVGVYVAFDPSASDATAMAACDDDGDYVVVLSDAMLRLTDDIANAASMDEADGSHRVEQYAALVARAQLPGRRLVPPPAGSYVDVAGGATHEDRLREALAFLVARELAHLRAGDLVCPRPSATHEHGDDVWTDAEQRTAREAARALYPGHAAERDTEAVTRMVAEGRATDGAEALLRFYAALEAQGPRVPTTYGTLHPQAAARLDAVRAARSTDLGRARQTQ